MEKTLVNLTLAVVTEEVENILDSYPRYPYQEAFSPSGLRQDLIPETFKFAARAANSF